MKQVLKKCGVFVAVLSLLCAAILPAAAMTLPAQREALSATSLMDPVNPNASQEAKNLLAYLYGLSDSKQFVVGQFDIATTGNTFENARNQFGVAPGLYSNRYILQTSGSGAGLTFEGFSNIPKANELRVKYYNEGAILLVHADQFEMEDYLTNKAKAGGYSDQFDYANEAYGMVKHLDKTDPDNFDAAMYADWKAYMDTYIDGLKQMEAAGVKAYLLRIFVEFNYRDFCGRTNEDYESFIRVYQQSIQYFKDSGLTGFLMAYSPGCYNNTYSRYPGNEWLDTIAVTCYCDNGRDGVPPTNAYDDYDWFTLTGKPIGFSELSCRSGGGYAPRSSYLNTLKSLIDRWPRTTWTDCWGDGSFALEDHDATGNYDNGQADGGAFLQSPFSVNLGNIADYQHGKFVNPGVAQIFAAKNQEGAYVGLEERLYGTDELKALGISKATLGSFHVNNGYGITFYKNADGRGPRWGSPVSLDDAADFTEGNDFAALKVSRLENLILNEENTFASDADENAYRVNDGENKKWEGYGSDGWVKVELAESITVSRWVVMHNGYTSDAQMFNTRDYELQYTLDGENWVPVDEVKGNTKPITDRLFAPVTADSFRLKINTPNSAGDPSTDEMSIVEWELYGLSSDNATSEGDEPTSLDLQIGEKEYYNITDGTIIYVPSLEDLDHIKVLMQNGVDIEGMSDVWSMSTDYLDDQGRGVLEVQVGDEGKNFVTFNLQSHYADCPGAKVKDFQVMMITAMVQKPGLYKVNGEWVYMANGEIQEDYSGFVKHDESNTWFYVTNGKIDWNLEGAFKHPSGIWFIVKGGQIDWGYNGFYKVQGVWFYFENGQINWNLTGLFKHPSGQWFYVQNAQINWGYTGFGKHLASNTWFYCENGTIAWSKSGAFKHPSGIWFMVNGGQIDWKYNGFYKVSGIWFYFENGQINWNLTGLYKLPSANAWFYVKNAQIDWSYNGKATKNGVTFNVRNGQVIF